MYKVVVFGTGGLSHFLVQHIRDCVHIVAYLDSFEFGRCIEGIPVLETAAIQHLEFDYVVIAFGNYVKGEQILLELGVDPEKIVGYHYEGLMDCDNEMTKEIEARILTRLRTANIEKLFDIPPKRYYLCTMNIPENRDVVKNDFVREQTLALLAKEIRRKDLAGHMAELGVFKGEFSRKINRLFPEKRLYLFDTFEGFPDEDTDNDVHLSWGDKCKKFQNTNITSVLNSMPYPDRCIVKKGRFPETFDLEDETFCLVSLDPDLYDPIMAGLERFYPRLVPGGYIMIHDYNQFVFSGAQAAVQDFCAEKHLSYVPVPDLSGTVIITK